MKKIFALALLLSIVFNQMAALGAPTPPELNAPSVILATENGEQILYSLNSTERYSPAGLSKMLVCLIALEKCDSEDIVIITSDLQEYVSKDDYNIGLMEGEKLSVKTLAQAAIISGANDATIALALHVSKGNIDEFVTLMNKRAQDLGCTDTHFTNPSGDYNENQYTTAHDMLKIFAKACSMPLLCTMLKDFSLEIPATNLSEERKYYTNNHLIHSYVEYKYRYNPALGGKTGYTEKGGHNIAAFANKNNMTLLCIVLGAQRIDQTTYSYVDAKNLFEYGYENYTPQTLRTLEEIVTETKLRGANKKDHITLAADETFKFMLDINDSADTVEEKINVPKYVKAPISKGDVIGDITFVYKGETIGKVDLVATEDVAAKTLSFWKVFGITVALILVFLIFVKPLIRRKMRAKKRAQRRSQVFDDDDE